MSAHVCFTCVRVCAFGIFPRMTVSVSLYVYVYVCMRVSMFMYLFCMRGAYKCMTPCVPLCLCGYCARVQK